MNNQSRPLFSVGEEVTIQSDIDSQHNGEVGIVELVTEFGKSFTCPVDGLTYIEDYYPRRYYLNTLNNGSSGWRQESLRKRYPPSSQSFSELINSLKTPAKMS